MARHPHVHRLRQRKPKDTLDILVYFATFVTPLFEVPQAVSIYSSKSAANVSILTWIFFLVADVVWLGYALHHKIRPLIVMYILYMIVEAGIVAGIILYS
jgi:uncharacterized protein with PQ loop repeat